LKDSKPPASGAPPAIRLEHAVVRLPRDGGVLAPLTLEIAAGGSHVLTGAAGSGKSAVIEMIGLARPPAMGVMAIFGEDVASVPPGSRHSLRRRIGTIFQQLRLIDDLSAYDNLALAARAADRAPEDYGQEITEALGWVGLGRRADSMVADLGEEGRRRLAVARAVINRPELILADEPAGRHGPAIMRLLADLNAAGMAILLATRDGTIAASAGGDVTHLAKAPSGLAVEPVDGWRT
jgi:cell division transport system ATP-binding protein